MSDRKMVVRALTRVRESGSVAGLVVVFLGSVVLALLAMAAGPASSGWLFQSPVSPPGPGPAASPAVPQGTVTGPALVAVPATLNFVPWVVGLLVVAAIVGAAMIWRRRGRGEGGDSA